MSRRHLLILLVLLAGIGLCAVWLVLEPAAMGPGRAGADSPAARLLPPPPEDDDLPVAEVQPVQPPPGYVPPSEQEIVRAPETPRESIDVERNSPQPQQPVQTTGPAATPAPGAGNLSPEQAALEAERQRRIEMLRAIKRPPNQTLGNARPRTRRPAETGRKELSEVTAKLRQDRRGLYANYYAFRDNPIAEFLDPSKPLIDARNPDVTRIDQQVYFPSKQAWADLTFDKGNFVATWEGYLVIEEAGDYWLYLGADLHGNIVLNGEFVLINDMTDYTEVSTVLTLSAGLHPIRIQYLEGRNGSRVQELGSCNFMYVPKGQSKPVPVPASMLLLPERLWSDDAPIITRLSRASGEIGDEITIHGQNLGGVASPPFISTNNGMEILTNLPELLKVEIAGCPAKVEQVSDNAITVRIPIGAASGKVIVHKSKATAYIGGSMGAYPIYSNPIPSNSVELTVTTQFGLYASWHNLAGWSKYDFIEPTMHEPDVVRLEREFMFETREKLDLPFRNNPLACRWEGKLGVPSDWAKDARRLVRFQAHGRLRVNLDGTVKATTAPVGGENDLTTLDFEVPAGEERYLPLAIDWTSESGPAGLRVTEMELFLANTNPVDVSPIPIEIGTLPSHLFFPPVAPPKAPQIVSARAVWPEGDQPPQLPYLATTSRPSIREGQSFEFTMEVYGNAEVRAQTVYVHVDGKPVQYEVTSTQPVNATTERRLCVAELPTGLGEGEMIARMAVVTSPPFLIDVTNKGLIAYLYDLPNAGGYTKMPDLDPLQCFLVRKDAQVNFENANDFNLPFPAETFAVEWFGAIIVEREGEYIFTGRSDDGILVWLNGDLVLADDNLHYQREKSSQKIRLSPGMHTLRMQFFENNVHEVSVLYWQAADEKGEFLAKQVIPKRNFTWDRHPPLPSKTSTGKRTDGSDPQ